MMKRMSPAHFALSFMLAVGTAAAADIHVDASATGGDGSQAAPFATIKAAVDAANLLSGASTIHVASGTYAITAASDLVTVSVPNLTITAANPANKPVIALDANLSAATNNPVIFTVPIGSDHFTVSGLAFTYSFSANGNGAGNTLGASGSIFSVAANYATFESCTFTQIGNTGTGWAQNRGGLIHADSAEKLRSTQGTHFTVRDCIFTNFGGASNNRPIMVANEGRIYNNIFDSCSGYVNPVKACSGGYFVSNRVVNCSRPIYSYGNNQNFNEWNDAEVAYNIFVNSGVQFFYKGQRGFAGNPKIHHNTVVGCSEFITAEPLNSVNTTWKPWIFDNLILTADGGSIICENASAALAIPTSFKTGSFFKGNAYKATTFSSGTALKYDGYELGLNVSDNKELAAVPEFLDTTDVTSANFYRLNSHRYPWVRSTAQGATGYEATYVGAVEPDNTEVEPGEIFELDDFSMDISTNVVPATADFAVSYTGNAGAVTVEWDFDGDGTWDQAGSATNSSWTYAVPGDFHPKVRLTDAATSKTVIGELASALKLRMMDVYVDANAAAGGNGTETAPLCSISAAMPLCAAHGTVHIRSGDNRVYNIATADDLVTVSAERYMTITKWGEERAKIVVASTLHSVTNNPSVISIPVGVVHTTISGLDFTYYGSSTKDAPDSSLGKSGRCIDVQGAYTIVDDCVFHQAGNYTDSTGKLTYSEAPDGIGHAAVATRAHEHNQDNGQHLTVSRCIFLGESDDRSMRATRLGGDATLSGNIFSNCCYVLWAVKSNPSSYLIESNVLYRCGTVSSGIYGSWNEFQNVKFRYNIFWCDSGSAVPFITKNNHGLNNSVLFHHNTIVNASHFAEIQNNKCSWHPQIFDNLFVLDPASEDGLTVFKNNQTAFADGCFSSFKTGSDGCLKNNAWYAPGGISSGAATQVAGYDLSAGCVITNNVALSAHPKFVSIDPASEDFCVPRKSSGAWSGRGYALTELDGVAYPDFIGAKPGLACYTDKATYLFMR